jgi:hypothetical protein
MLSAEIATVRLALLAAGITSTTVLASYTHLTQTEQLQTYEVAAWYTRYELPAGQTVPVYAQLEETYRKGMPALFYSATLAAVQVEDHCPSLFGGCPVPGSAPKVPTGPVATTRTIGGHGTHFPHFAAQPGVVLTPEGELFLALVQPLYDAYLADVAARQARIEAQAALEAQQLLEARKPASGDRVRVYHCGKGSNATVERYDAGSKYCHVRTDHGTTSMPDVISLVYLDEVPA